MAFPLNCKAIVDCLLIQQILEKPSASFHGRRVSSVLWLGGTGISLSVPPITFGHLGPENLDEACASFPQLQNNRRIGDRKYDDKQKYGQRRLGVDAR